MHLALFALALATPQDATPKLSERAEWLRASAIEISPALDRAALAARIGDARVVLLGEPTHADGSVFEVKIELVRALHEDLGFDVLVFESGLHGCHTAWAKFVAGDATPVAAASLGVFPIWTRSAQMAPLWQYLAAEARAEHPLELAGYDSQITGGAAQRLADDLAVFLEVARIKPAERDLVLECARAAARGEGVADFAKRAKPIARAFESAARAVGRARSIEERAFWARVLESLGAECARLAQPVKDGASLAAGFNPRDAIGGENLVWLANERYRGRKLIVWLATMHGQRDPARIDTRTPGLDYSGVEPAGLHLARALKRDAYSIAFVCAEGRGGLPWQAPGPSLAAPEAGSFEALCVEAGLTRHLVDLRGAPARHWLRERLVARPLAHTAMVAAWPDIVDAFAFVRERRPSTALDGGAADADSAPFDLVPEVVREMDAARDGEAGGNVWAHKWSSAATFARWRANSRPDADALAAAERELLAVCDALEADDTRRWRALDVLAALAAARGNAPVARERWLAALDAYVFAEVPDPAKHSGFQHLLNRAARHLQGSEGTAAAATLITARVGADARAAAVHVDDWAGWVGDADYARILDAFSAGLTAREERFPAERAAIRAQLAQLRRARGD